MTTAVPPTDSPSQRCTITGARLVNADGSLTDLLDIGIDQGAIASIEPTRTRRPRGAVIEAIGRLALPGFIDAHVHGEAVVTSPDVQLAMLRQGVTTVVLGQDGVSFAPSPAGTDTAAWAGRYFAAVNGAHPDFSTGGVADLLATYDHATALNVAYLAPAGTIRYAVMGTENRAADEDERTAMKALLSAALDEGACGVSTGLEYLPGGYATTSELIDLTAVAAARGLPHVSHMRGYDEEALPALDELFQIAAASGVATHVSHLHGDPEAIIASLDGAITRGLDVTFDTYPYGRGCSILAIFALPGWLPSADPDATIAALGEPETAQRVITEHLAGLDGMWHLVTLAAAPTDDGDDLGWVEGLALPEVAARMNLTPAQTVLELLTRTRLRVTCIFARGHEVEYGELIHHPGHMAGSDAIYFGSYPHPRGWGAFAKFLREQVLQTGRWTWPHAIWHLSTAAARRFGLVGRGQIDIGAVADIALLDPESVTDVATYDDPRRPATGVDDVLVRGVQVLAGGELTGALPGGGIRPEHPVAREHHGGPEHPVGSKHPVASKHPVGSTQSENNEVAP